MAPTNPQAARNWGLGGESGVLLDGTLPVDAAFVPGADVVAFLYPSGRLLLTPPNSFGA